MLEREQSGLASADEREELERYLLQKDLRVIAKARAQMQLART